MIRPFQGALLHSPNPGEIVAPSLAGIDREAWSQAISRNPNNILSLMPETYPWESKAVELARDRAPRLLAAEYQETAGWFAYRVEEGPHGQTGLVCMIDADSYPGDVRPHEQVKEAVVPGVVSNYEAVGVSVNPVSLMSRSEDLEGWLRTATADTDPLIHFTADDGVSETVWHLPEPPDDLIDGLLPTYIADGHHRAAAAARIADDGAAFDFMAVVYPVSEMRVLGFHRLLRNCEPGARETLKQLSTGAASTDPPQPDLREVAVCDGDQWELLPLAGAGDGRLDPQLLQDEILSPIFGVSDPAAEPRLEFVPGNVPLTALQKDVGPGDLAFVMQAVPVEAVLELADAGRTVPPKSTWFSPKARAGLFVQRIG